MLTVILVLALIASLALNVAQDRKISNMKQKRTSETKVVRKFIKGIVVESCNLKAKNSDLERRLEELERQIKESNERITKVEREIKTVERKVKTLEEANGIMANNNYQLIKEGKIIKSIYNNVTFPYKFQDLTQEEIISFFGRIG